MNFVMELKEKLSIFAVQIEHSSINLDSKTSK